MPIFQYRAFTDAGKKIRGIIDADSYDLAKEKLMKEKIFVTKIFLSQARKEPSLTPSMLLAFTRELSQLLTAGLPLYESLLTMEEKYRTHRSHSLFLDFCDRLKNGHFLSTVLSKYKKTFDPIYIAMVRAGEKTGSLSWAFQQLHAFIEKRQKLKKKLMTSMAYPAFLGAFCLCVILGLFLFVIPSMQELFEDRQLHPLTYFVLNASQFVHNHCTSLALLFLSVMSGIVALCKTASGKLYIHTFVQKIPFIKTILLQSALVRFCRSSSILLFGGVPLIQALKASRGTMKHANLEREIENAEKHLLQGSNLSISLKKSPVIPALVSRMLAIAEETGRLPEMLESLSDIYDQDLERNLTHITTFLQPVLLIFLGGIVGLVILSILLPLTDVSSLISH